MADRALTPDQLAELLLWVDQYAGARQEVSEATSATTAALVAGLVARGAVYDEATVADVAAQAAEAVATSQRLVAEAATAVQERALDALMSVPLPGRPRPFGSRRPRLRVRPLPTDLRGIDPLEEWQRPARQYRYARSVGLSHQDATDRAIERAEALARDDVALADRVATQRALSAATDDVRGYRRVIRPELSEGGVCGLCIAASDRVYKVGQLLPVHGRCKCAVLPWLRGQADPGRALNVDELDAIYDLAGSTGAADLKKTRWRVDEHGELGPVLLAADAPPADDRPSALAA